MRSFPWDSIITGKDDDNRPILDRAYSAQDLRDVYETFFSNGVFVDEEDAFQVEASDGMSVVVSPGKCCISGSIGWEGVNRKLSLQAASSAVDRIDTVVLRFDSNIEQRDIDLYVKTGVSQEVPVRPSLTRNDTVYELGICDVYIPKNSQSVSQSRITDTRLESERCGVVAPFIDVDTTSFFNQLQAQTSEAVELSNAAMEGSIVGQLQQGIDDAKETADGKVSKSGDTMSGALTLSTPLAVSSGGTGADTAASARSNLSVPALIYDTHGYPGLATPLGTTATWIRTGVNGLLPYEANGSGGIGSSSWPFSTGYFKNLYVNGKSVSGYSLLGRDARQLVVSSLAIGSSSNVSATTGSWGTKPDLVTVSIYSFFRANVTNVSATTNSNNSVTLSATVSNMSPSAGQTYVWFYIKAWKSLA